MLDENWLPRAASVVCSGENANGSHASMVRFGYPNSAGITPITRNESPSSKMSRPSTLSLAPNRARQSLSLRTTTRSLPGVASSSVNTRPIRGVTRSTENNDTEARIVTRRNGSPSPPSVRAAPAVIARLSSDFACSRRSR
jgi:hypothetical protein